MAWHASRQIGRGGSPSNTLRMRGTETSSPELLAAWRVLAAQGPMGQERRCAEVVETSDKEELFEVCQQTERSQSTPKIQKLNRPHMSYLNPRWATRNAWRKYHLQKADTGRQQLYYNKSTGLGERRDAG